MNDDNETERKEWSRTLMLLDLEAQMERADHDITENGVDDYYEDDGKCEACGVPVGLGCCDDCPLYFDHPQDKEYVMRVRPELFRGEG